MNCHHAERRREGAMARPARCNPRPSATPRILEISSRHLRRRQHAAMAGLGALADLELDHLDLVVGGDAGERFGIEAAVEMAAAEIAGADLPDDVAAVLAVIGAEAALAGVVREAALPGAGIQRAHGVGAERAKTHRGNVEHRGRIGLRAIRAADGDAEFSAGMRLRRDRVMHPLVAVAVDVLLGAERPLVELASWRADRPPRGCRARTACRPSRSRRSTAASPGGSLRAGSGYAPRSGSCAEPRGSSA